MNVSDWVHLVPAGTFSGVDGRGPYHLRNPQAVIEASMASGKLPIDENHSTDLAAPRGGPSPARGWIVRMEQRPDGIWARVDWTSEGKRLLEGGAYRGISPVLVNDKSGTVLQVQRAALTNVPNLPQLATLHSQGATTLTAEELKICRMMNLDPAAFAAHRAPTAHAANPRPGSLHTLGNGYLTQQEIDICNLLRVDPAKYLEKKRNGEAPPGVEGDGLTADENRVCKAMGINPATLRALRAKSMHAAAAAAPEPTAEEARIAWKMGIDPAKLVEQRGHTAKQQAQFLGLTDAEYATCEAQGIAPKDLAIQKYGNPYRATQRPGREP